MQPFFLGATAGALRKVVGAVSREEPTNKGDVKQPKLLVKVKCPVKPVNKRSRVQEQEVACEDCAGSGRMTCPDCNGKARTNYVSLEVLPEGVWPKWYKP